MNKEQERELYREVVKLVRNKVLDPLCKKALKEHERADKKCVTYKGIEYYTDDELYKAYFADIFDSSKLDDLTDKLINKKGMSGANKTKTDYQIEFLLSYIGQMEKEIKQIMTEDEEKAYFSKIEEELKKNE